LRGPFGFEAGDKLKLCCLDANTFHNRLLKSA
jgi:hypothetical protein